MRLALPARALRRLAPRSVRARASLAAVLVVAVALGLASLALVVLLHRALDGGVRDAAQVRAQDVADRLAAQDPAAALAGLADAGGPDLVVQVLDASGRVLAATSPRASGPVVAERPAPGARVVRELHDAPLFGGHDGQVVVLGAQGRDGPLVVVVAASTEEAREVVLVVGGLLLAGYPVVVAVVGGATSVLVGRTLDPVERIRRRVAGIGATTLGERVPVPAGDDEVARLARTMNGMLERLERAQVSQRRFVADASHELRSPLATVRATLEVARADATGRTWRDLAPAATAELDRMARLVADLLDLARADEGGAARQHGDVDLDELVEHEARRLRATGAAVEVTTTPVRTRGDARRLAQVLANLGDNAARHAASAVVLRLRADGDGAEVTVDDDGPGVPADQRGRVFERFVRLDASRQRDSGGTGLGLAIAAEVARAHGGSVRCEPSPLGGARFVVRLPVR